MKLFSKIGPRVCLFGLVMIFGLHTSAQVAPKYSNEFLSIGVGARAAGMSNSVIAGTRDVNAAYWNPSSLVHMENKIELAYMHNNYFGGIGNYDFGALGVKLKDEAALAVSFVRLGIDGIPNTLDLINNGQIDYDRIKEFSAVDYAFMVSYARKTNVEGLTIGANAKVINRIAGDFAKAWGFGIDASATYETASGWHMGVMARDVTSTFNAWSYNFTEAEKDVFEQTGNEIPENSLELTLPKFQLGIGRQFAFSDKFGFYPELDMDLTTDGKRNTLLRTGFVSVDPRVGMEFDFRRLIFLRLGAGNFQQIDDIDDGETWTWQPNFGVGLHLRKFALDYALTDVGDQSDVLYSHVFSIRFNLQEKDAE